MTDLSHAGRTTSFRRIVGLIAITSVLFVGVACSSSGDNASDSAKSGNGGTSAKSGTDSSSSSIYDLPDDWPKALALPDGFEISAVIPNGDVGNAVSAKGQGTTEDVQAVFEKQIKADGYKITENSDGSLEATSDTHTLQVLIMGDGYGGMKDGELMLTLASSITDSSN